MKQAVLLIEFTDEQFEKSKDLISDTYELVRSLDDVEDLDNVEVLLNGHYADIESVFEDYELKNVKWVHHLAAGVNGLPLDLLKERGITLTASNGVATNAMPESLFGAILGHTRDIFGAYDRKRVKFWQINWPMPELKGKTMMILGIGDIGQQVARVAKAFDMNVIGVNYSGREVEYMDVQYVQDEAKDHVNEADIIVNILPSTKETKDYCDAEFFDKMNEGTIFANIGRGETVDEEALLAALDTDKIDFAILDVFKTEPLPQESPFWTHPKVLPLSHQTAGVDDFFGASYDIFVENVKEVKNGGKPTIHVKNLDTGY